MFSGDGDPNEYLLESYEYYVNQWLTQEPTLRKITPTVYDAGQLKSEDEIRMFIIAFRSMVQTLATLRTFSKFDWADLEIALGEEKYEGYKSWYLYYRDQLRNPNPSVPVPVDVDFDIELIRTDRINVVYILNLLKKAQQARAESKSDEDMEAQRQTDVDLVLREIERSDNESLRLKKDLITELKKTGSIPAVNQEDLSGIYVPVPSLPEQQRIADFFTALDAQIENERALLEDWRQLKKGLLQQMFI